MNTGLSRRSFLTRSALIGCSAAASPLLTPISMAAATWDMRLVVIILRGGLDGLDAVRPYGDPAFAEWRPTLGTAKGELGPDLDGFFGLHPALATSAAISMGRTCWRRARLEWPGCAMAG